MTDEVEIGTILGGYWLWQDIRLETELAQRGYELAGHEWTHAEMAAALDGHDRGDVSPKMAVSVAAPSTWPW